MAIILISQLLSFFFRGDYFSTRRDPPFISHYAIIQGEMGLFLTFSVFELQRGYLYQNGVEFRQNVIGAGLNLFWGHLNYPQGVYEHFPRCRSREQVPP